jgi:hypothetical protein
MKSKRDAKEGAQGEQQQAQVDAEKQRKQEQYSIRQGSSCFPASWWCPGSLAPVAAVFPRPRAFFIVREEGALKKAHSLFLSGLVVSLLTR